MFFSFFTWSTCLRRITSWRERILRAKKFDEVLCRQRQTRAKVPEKKSSNFLHTLLICPRKMTSANDEFMILTVGWLSTHLYDDKMPLTEFKSGTDSKKVNPGDRILMQPSFQLPSYSMSAAAASSPGQIMREQMCGMDAKHERIVRRDSGAMAIWEVVGGARGYRISSSALNSDTHHCPPFTNQPD